MPVRTNIPGDLFFKIPLSWPHPRYWNQNLCCWNTHNQCFWVFFFFQLKEWFQCAGKINSHTYIITELKGNKFSLYFKCYRFSMSLYSVNIKCCCDKAYDFTGTPDFRNLIGLVDIKYSFQIDKNSYRSLPLLLSQLITYTLCSHNNVSFAHLIYMFT